MFTFIVGLLLTIVLIVYEGLAIKLLWGWYVVPLGVPEIVLIQGYGIALLVSIMTGSLVIIAGVYRDLPAWLITVVQVIAITAALFMGWLASGYMPGG